ncbi:MAG: type II toxin-antitoxin system VapC family toxin [Gemmatimonadota bacterium]|nr:type II toxin-antitoxin system VapC family toxin [Gemmatimonadota bacterium]
MKGLDTNVLVRYLTQDDPEQSKTATRQIETDNESFFITSTCLCELVWVLETAYDYDRSTISDTLRAILQTRQFAFDDKLSMEKALYDYQHSKGDFSDYVLGHRSRLAGCNKTLTFDRALKNHQLFQVL